MDLLDLQQSTLVLSTLLLIDTFKATNMLAASTPLYYLCLATFAFFFSLLYHFFNFQSRHYVWRLPRDDHNLSLPFILIASRFDFCFQPLH